MSHQTGIHATDELKATFAKCKAQTDIRCIKLSIDKEKLVCDETKPMSISSHVDWKHDWKTYMVESFLPKQRPCYVLFRLGETNHDDDKGIAVKTPPTTTALKSNARGGNQWLFVSWTPESSPVREKMIYASTKSTVKQEFGGGSIFADYFVAGPEDLSVDSVRKWIERKQHIRDGHIDMNELSHSEQELQQVKADEAALCADLLASAASLKEKNKSLPSIEMPIADEAIKALYDFKQGKSAYVQMSIDPKSETILLEKNESASGFDLSKKSISSMTPKDHARYHLVSYNHQHNKKQTKATLFIYSIPSSGCPVKERMLYSSVKNSLLKVIQDESKIGIDVVRRIETDDPSELTEKFLYEEIYPVETTPSTPQAFVKPKGPSKQTISSRRRVM